MGESVKTSGLSVLLIFLLFVGMPLAYASPIAFMHIYHYSQQATVTLNLTWFECGLLYKYGIDNFIAVLEQFHFNGVMIQPFMLDAEGQQTVIYENLSVLCNQVDLYADNHFGFKKFLFVGGCSYIDKTLVNAFADRDYVLCVDDGTTDLNTLRTVLQYLKNQNVETLLVHGFHPSYKTVIEEGLVDYSSPCFYPSWPNGDWIQYTFEFTYMRSWSKGKCKFVPGIQVFGGTPVRWLFPNSTQVDEMAEFLQELDSDGVMWFLPHSGESLRGEWFEGFLEHPEIHICIQGAPSNVGISILLVLFGILLMSVLIISIFLFLKLKEIKVKIEPPVPPEKQIDEKHKACMNCGKKFLNIRTFCPYCLTYHDQDGVKKT